MLRRSSRLTKLGHVTLVVVTCAATVAGQKAAPPLFTSDLLSGLSLRTIGPAAVSGRVVDLAVVESDPSIFYAATAAGGVWKTTNSGVAFEPVFEHERVHSIGAVAVSQQQPEIVWVGTGEATNHPSSSWGDGVYRSTDAGRSWQHAGLRDTKHIGRIAIHPTNADIVFVAALGHLWGPNRERGLFKSVDGGATWRNVLFVDNDTGVADVAIDPADAKIMFAAAYQRRRRAWGFHGGGPGSALYKSIDGGDTWTKLVKDLPEGDQGRIGITVSRGDQPVVYARIEQGLRYDAVDAYAERRAGIYRSVDRGDTWERMGDWNPRPTAASQIRVDPNDAEGVYLTGTFSFSSDAGRTFEMDRASSGAGDQVLWINPRDSRHLIRGGGAGIAISRDRGETWTNTAPLPATEVSRVSVDMRRPFWVYAGLETHGSWAGPSSPPVDQGSGGEWIRTGDGDGFANVIDPSDNRTLYTSSQFLGLSRLDVVTGERTSIRPGDSKDHADGRRNWEAWSRPLLSQDRAHTRAGANRDAPVIVSPHDPKTIYAATTDLWRSYDRGRTWATLGNRTTSVDRTTLRVMTQLPTETTLSLDDGAPYYPTISAVAESPVQKGVLFVGTDDGNVQLSRDTGRTWLTIANRFPDLPKASYVSAIEMSRLDVQKVYVAFDNHRNDDYTSYLYRTTDGGTTWEAIDGDLPSERVIHVVREDPKNPAVLYVGTALGAYVSADSGSHWVELELNLPRVAVHDLVVHPRDNDLVLATHGRGIWILDNLSAIQGLTPEVLASDAHLFPIEPAESVRQVPPTAAADDAASRPAGAPAGAIMDYYLRSAADAVALTVHDSAGRLVATVDAAGRRGVNRAEWNLGSAGAAVAPGTYTVRLAVRGQTFDRPLVVSDPVRPVDRDAALRADRRAAAMAAEGGRARRD